MTAVRRTISLPSALAQRLDEEAKRSSISFSALIAEMLTGALGNKPVPYVGLIDDDPDLSEKVEEILQRLAIS